MSPKRKSGLQKGLSEIVERQTAPVAEKSRQSAALISKFSESKLESAAAPSGIPPRNIPHEGIPHDGIPDKAQTPPKRDALDPSSLVNVERGYYPTFNDISDRLVPELKLNSYEQVIFFRLYRLSRGWQKETCVIGLTRLAKQTNLSRSKVQQVIAQLTERKLIEYVAERGQQGTEYKILPGVPVLERGIPQHGIPHGEKGIPQHGTGRQYGIPQRGPIKNNKGIYTNKDKKGEPNRLTPEDITSYAATVGDLLREGQSIEQIEGQFAASMHPEDWRSVRHKAEGK